jgi:hypothetical protein
VSGPGEPTLTLAESGLEPDLIEDFDPDALLNFAYGGNQIQPGTAIPQSGKL